MDPGTVGFGGWGVGSNPEAKRRLYGYGHGPPVDPGRAPCGGSEDDFRCAKVAKADDFLSAPDKADGVSNGAPLRSNGSSPVFFSVGDPQQQHMLCFSSPKSDVQSPHLSHSSSSLYGKNSGGNVYGNLFSRGPFTPSQYMELEHQALIYKYIMSNVPVPSNLLVPIKKAFESAMVAYHSGGLFRSDAVGWGSFHLGLSRSNDPEPGRCRRTDGKKWRCSKEAVADQKYCEKHMNRGRHRSRKPVEGQTGHSVSAATTTTISSKSPLVGPGSGISSSMNINRMLMDEQNLSRRLKDSADIYLLSPTFHLKSKEDPFSISSKQQLLETVPNRSVHQFMNDWPENPSTDPTITSAQPDLQSDGTQLSIAIPTASSLETKKASSFFQLGPLHELDKVEMIDLGVGIGSKQGSCWVPILWEASMGGPLGEALKSTNSSPMGCKTSAASTSPSFESSPTGVLQRTTFVPLTNSSAGSSPGADDSKNAEGA